MQGGASCCRYRTTRPSSAASTRPTVTSGATADDRSSGFSWVPDSASSRSGTSTRSASRAGFWPGRCSVGASSARRRCGSTTGSYRWHGRWIFSRGSAAWRSSCVRNGGREPAAASRERPQEDRDEGERRRAGDPRAHPDARRRIAEVDRRLARGDLDEAKDIVRAEDGSRDPVHRRAPAREVLVGQEEKAALRGEDANRDVLRFVLHELDGAPTRVSRGAREARRRQILDQRYLLEIVGARCQPLQDLLRIRDDLDAWHIYGARQG